MWGAYMGLLPLAGLLAQGQYDLDPLPPFPDHVQYNHYGDQIGKRSPFLVGSQGQDPGSFVTSLPYSPGALG